MSAQIEKSIESQWIERTYGSRWPNTPSPQSSQIYEMECVHCKFNIHPGTYRTFDEHRKDHPMPYGNFASISHARKVMKDHIKAEHLQGGAL